MILSVYSMLLLQYRDGGGGGVQVSKERTLNLKVVLKDNNKVVIWVQENDRKAMEAQRK